VARERLGHAADLDRALHRPLPSPGAHPAF
jgi:hypothetical protein